MKQRTWISALLAVLTVLLLPSAAYARDILKNTDPDKYYILLDTNNQVVTVYEKDDQGEYTHITRRFICTSGRTEIDPTIPDDQGTPTPRGTWKIGGRERFGKFASFANEYARYWTQIVGGNYFHSIMFARRNVNSMKQSPYYTLGNAASHGCVRLYVEDAKWLYYYACPGTTVKVSHSEPSDPELTRSLKSSMAFSDYNTLQKNFFDTPELPNYTAWTVVEDADMRTGNGSNDSRIALLPLGTPVEVLQEGDPWCKVLYNKREGYIRLAYLSFTEGLMNSTSEASLIKSTVYLLKEPKRDSEVIFKVPTYTSVKVLDRDTEGYVHVSIWGKTGYIAERSLVTGWGTLRK
ncbi:MAG: SH3 domain-containing protein [Eubacteriales bacterium]|nr:SH3 domain-containing protein [Eubacteriales bacterium]